MSSERFSHWTGSAGLRNLWVWRVATVRDQDAASQLMDILHLCAGMRSVQLALLICLNTEPGPRWIHDTFPKLKQLNISLYIYTILYMYIIVYYFCPLSLTLSLALAHILPLNEDIQWTRLHSPHQLVQQCHSGNRSDPRCPQRCQVSAEPCHMHFPGCCLDPPGMISFATLV